MASHARSDASPFRKKYLVPLWCIRIFFMALSIIANVLVLAALAYIASDDELDNELESKYSVNTSSVNVAIALTCVIIVFMLVCLVLDIVCIVKRSRHTLRPKFFLLVNIFQTAVWTAMFVLRFFAGVTIVSIILALIPL